MLDWWLPEASCCLLRWDLRSSAARPAIHMEKQLGWAYKLGGAESLGIMFMESQMESQIWHQIAGSVVLFWEGLAKR